MKYIVIGRPNCKWCTAALNMLTSRGLEYEYFEAVKTGHGVPAAVVAHLLDSMGLTTVPQVWHGTEHVGGYEQLLWYLVNQEVAEAAAAAG